MSFLVPYAANAASGWIASTVEGAKEAAAAYGGNLAGDVISSGAGLVEGAGRAVGGSVAGYAKGYGDWVSGYGDKLSGKGSALPKSGPLAAYKGGGAGSGALKRSASYGPATSSGKALTKSTSTVKGTAGSAAGGASKAKTAALNSAGGAIGAGSQTIKPYTSFVPGSDNKENVDAAAKKRKPKKKPDTNSALDAASKPKPTYSKPASQRPTGNLARTQSLPQAGKTKTGDKPNNKPGAYKAAKTKTVNGQEKVKISSASKPQSKPYTPYSGPPKGVGKPGGGGGGGAGAGHLGLPSGLGDTKSGGGGGDKGFKPYSGPAKGIGSTGQGGAKPPEKLDRGFF